MCRLSAVVKQKGFVPRHLRPPWLNSPIFDDNELSSGENTCYACYKGTKASNGMAPGEEYCACTYKGQVPNEKFGIVFGTFNRSRRICLRDLQKIAFMPSCGNKYYDHVKHCAMVHFYENDPDKNPKEDPPKIRQIYQLSKCFWGASRQTAFKGTIQIKASVDGYGTSGASPFTFPVVFKNRHCWDPINYYTSSVFYNITITLSGDCGTTKYELPWWLNADKGRVQEMRGLQLDLKSGEIAQWRRFGDYEFEKESGDLLHWKPTDLGIINEYGKPIRKTY
ncbi:hypothetical protein niasHT_027481 [Heterodera trifolii]|uniref:Uncharacterized protein n=1 Tax=Heterodera trifolii TaxID=157864 RepID=A0ABD2JMM1_9BILA